MARRRFAALTLIAALVPGAAWSQPAAMQVAKQVALQAGDPAGEPAGTWEPVASLRTARQETGAARIGDAVFVVGGLTEAGATASVERYDAAAGAWRDIAPMPAPRDHMAAVALAGRLHVIGGYGGDFAARDSHFVYQPATDTWSSAAPLPEPRGACWAVEVGGRIYLFGGTDPAGRARGTTFVYDPPLDRWSEGAPMPTAREHLNAVALDDSVYVLGGRDGASTPVNERYEPAADRWSTRAPMPSARAAMAAAALGGEIYAMGGETPRLFDVNEVYDPASDSWRVDAPMAIPRHGVAAVPLEDRILVPGGGVIQGLRPSALVDAFVPPPAEPAPVTLRFSQAGRAVREGDGAVELVLRRDGPLDAAVSVSVATVETSAGEGEAALSGEDFAPLALEVVLDAGVEQVPVTVELIDDAVEEPIERFAVALRDPVGATLGEPAIVTVTIEDDDGAASVDGRAAFTAEVFAGAEDAGAVTVTVARDGGNRGRLAVRWSAEQASAVDGEDFVATGGILEWADGEAGERSFTVELVDDDLAEGTELVDVTLFPEPFAPTPGLPNLQGLPEPGDRVLDRAVIAIQDDDAGPGCAAGEATLCLQGGRFQVETEWRDLPSGRRGRAGARGQLDATGILWFFEPANFELLVKVLDGRAINGSFWLFYAALSDVEYWVLATDTATGTLRAYHNPGGTRGSVGDIDAFPTGAANLGSANEPAALAAATGQSAAPAAGDAPCRREAAPSTLCLRDGRFAVTVELFEGASSRTATAVADPEDDQSGLFWFFTPDNLEVAVKILDGRAINSRYWLFFGALSNLRYTLRVEDTLTGQTRIWENPAGAFASVADVEAFSDP